MRLGRQCAPCVIMRQKFMEHIPTLATLLLILVLALIPTGFENKEVYRNAEKCQAKILEVNNSNIIDTGLVRSGEQSCKVEFVNGKYKGQTAAGVNMLSGSLEADKIFAPGDSALAAVYSKDGSISSVTLIDHYRLNWELILGGVFCLFLILFAGKTGLRAILSFFLTVLVIWKVLVPLFLQGFQPVWTGLILTAFLVVMIIGLVYGFDKRFLSAAAGSCAGLLLTAVLGVLFTDLFQIHGAVMSSSESLLYSGYSGLSLTQIFMASIFIGSSGAMMDLAVDITSAMYEIAGQNPGIARKALLRSGMNVGKAAMGTMTTTLLLAYSGGFMALLMVFMAQGTPVDAILNYKYVAAEIIHTIVGSFGLVLVAPLTAVAGAFFFSAKTIPAEK